MTGIIIGILFDVQHNLRFENRFVSLKHKRKESEKVRIENKQQGAIYWNKDGKPK